MFEDKTVTLVKSIGRNVWPKKIISKYRQLN